MRDRALLHVHDALVVIAGGVAPLGGLPARPALAPWCRVVEDGRRVLLEHGGTVVTLEGRAATALVPRLLPLLDGSRTADEVLDTLGTAARPAVQNALSILAEQGLLTEGPLARSDGGVEVERRDLRRLHHGPLHAGARTRTPCVGARRDRRVGAGRRGAPSAAPAERRRARGALSRRPRAGERRPRRRRTQPRGDRHARRAQRPGARPASRRGSRCCRMTGASWSPARSTSPCLGVPHVLAHASRRVLGLRGRLRPRRRSALARTRAGAARRPRGGARGDARAAMARDRRSCAPRPLLRARGPLGRHAALRPCAARAAVPLVRAGASGGPLPLVRVGAVTTRLVPRSEALDAAGGSRLAACGDRHPHGLGDAHDRRVAAAELRVRARLVRPHAGRARGRLGQRCASRSGPRAGRGPRRGARALLGALPPARRHPARDGARARLDGGRPRAVSRSSIRRSWRCPASPARRSPGRRGPRGSKARGSRTGQRAFLPAELVYLARRSRACPSDRVLDQQRSRVRTHPARGHAGGRCSS